jgi:hypothetical protein
MTPIAGLLVVIGKIVMHFLENKTPEAKADYVKNLEGMSKALIDSDVDTVNSLFDGLRREAGFSDGVEFDEELRRNVQGDGGLD